MIKNKLKKIICCLLLVVFVSQATLVSAVGITNPNHWGKNALEWAMDKELIKGDNHGEVDPDKTLTRAEFITIIAKYVNAKQNEKLVFSDVDKSSWYYDHISRGVYANLVAGYPDKTFKPNDNITRQEVAVVVYNALKRLPKVNNNRPKDMSNIAGWAAAPVLEMMQSGLINGYTDGEFKAENLITYAELASILCNYDMKPKAEQEIIVYGDSLAAVSTAVSMANGLPNGDKIHLVIPTTSDMMGGLATAGAQNFWDIFKDYDKCKFYSVLFNQTGNFYEPMELSNILKAELAKYPSIEITKGVDIVNIEKAGNTVKSIDVSKLKKDEKGHEVYVNASVFTTMKADIFIDASDEGKIVKKLGLTVVGNATEGLSGAPQTATLMFKLSGLDYTKMQPPGMGGGKYKDPIGGEMGVWSDIDIENDLIKEFNEGDDSFSLKGYNAAEVEEGTGVFWLNMLICDNIRGDIHKRDLDIGFFSETDLGDFWCYEEGYDELVALVGTAEFLEVIREVPGFEEAELVGYAEKLYIRETVHMKVNGGYVVDYNKPLAKSGIAFSNYAVDLHPTKDTPVRNFKASGPIWIPERAVKAVEYNNLYVSGYGISVDHIYWGSVRVLPSLTFVGEGVGNLVRKKIKGM